MDSKPYKNKEQSDKFTKHYEVLMRAFNAADKGRHNSYDIMLGRYIHPVNGGTNG